jgi:curved DNA-binding protein CbpA
MDGSEFIDYYEILEISPNANAGALERMFRYLAQRYHPDNPETGDRDRFDLVLEANATLKDPAKRAQYDIRHKERAGTRTASAENLADATGIERDVDIQNRLMSIFYVRRRQNIRDPGVPDFELERLLDSPIEHLEFHIWYLKAKGWIERLDNGMLAITIAGVDRANSEHKSRTINRLLTDRSQTG